MAERSAVSRSQWRFILWGLWCWTAVVSAEEMEVQIADGGYSVEYRTVLEAPLHFVFEVLTDFDRLHLLETTIVESHRLEEVGYDTTYVQTRIRGCVMLFCRDINRVEAVAVRADTEIIAVAIPGRSNAVSYQHTTMSADGERTRVHYVMQIKPDFWVPAFIGRRAMARSVRRSTLNMFANVERLARQRAGLSELPSP